MRRLDKLSEICGRSEMKKRNPLTNQKGFTLIEIIAVLIILGILAAVAIPKYFDLQDDAAKSALRQAVSELVARDNLMWSKYKTRGLVDGAALTLTDLNTLAKVVSADGNFGDFTLDVLPSDGSAVATITSSNFNMTAKLTRTGATDSQPGVWDTTGINFVTP
jgi:prepilin-type N-terminal cleavage/methylation domain-containing protein